MCLNKRLIICNIAIAIIGGISYGLTIEPPPIIQNGSSTGLPNPVQIERQRIELKYNAKAPRMNALEGENTKKKEKVKERREYQPPIIIREYSISDAELTPQNPRIYEGTRIESKKKQAQTEQAKANASYTSIQNTSQAQTIMYTGYCKINKKITLSTESYTIVSPCIINRSKLMTATITFIPVIKEFKVIGKVDSINGQPVSQSIVRTSNLATDNLADEVDRRLIANILLATASQTGQQTSNMVSNIMQNSAEVNNTSSFGYSTTTVNPTQGLSKVPQASLYLGIANLIGSTANTISQNQQLPPLFTINKKDVYIQAEVTTQ